MCIRDRDYADEIRGEAGEPAIARGAGFPGCGEREAARADGGTGAVIEHVLQNAVDEICDTGVQDAARLRAVLFEGAAVGTHHAMQELGFGARAHGGECGVARGDIHGGHFIRAECYGGSGLNIGAQAHLAGDLDLSLIHI